MREDLKAHLSGKPPEKSDDRKNPLRARGQRLGCGLQAVRH
jgi:hypothetical protein